jgi:hypothetical protein
MVQETKVKVTPVESTSAKQSPISAKDVKAFDCSPDTSPAFQEFNTVAGVNVDTDVLPDVGSAAGPSGSTDELPDVTASGSLPPPGSFDSYEPGAPEDLKLSEERMRTYAGGFRRDIYNDDELRFGHAPPMSLPTRQRYRPSYDPMMSNPSPRSGASSYQFPPRSHTHFLREHGPSSNSSGRSSNSGRGRTAYPELFELRITIFREVLSLTLFNQFIPEITKMLRLAMREERVDVQGVHKNPHDFGVVLTFYVRPYNYMHEKMVTQVRSQLLKLAWEWRNYYDNPRYGDDAETYETLYYFLETCEVNLCRMTRNQRQKHMRTGFEEYRKKPAKQPKNHRSRQNLVKKEYEAVKELLGEFLIADKTYLRGKKVAFIQVKCPTALKKNAAFITSIVKDSNVTITRATVPLSRKKEGQLKGFLVYLETETEDCVKYIIENLFTQEYKDAGIKCKYGVFSKKTEDSNSNSNPGPASAEAPAATQI